MFNQDETYRKLLKSPLEIFIEDSDDAFVESFDDNLESVIVASHISSKMFEKGHDVEVEFNGTRTSRTFTIIEKHKGYRSNITEEGIRNKIFR